jgi:hypothetical protein
MDFSCIFRHRKNTPAMNKARINNRFLVIPLFLAFTLSLSAQNLNRIQLGDYEREVGRRVLHIPDLPGYHTLKGDFHIHTVFSDGRVWPDVRVQEAWKEGLDVIAITDHIEYRPHKDYIRGDHNVSSDIAQSMATELNIILIKGTEITRSMPPGHFNALFLEDVNPLDNDDPMAQIEAAAGQGAFVVWNHPGWDAQQPDTTLWWNFHASILEKGWLHGVEVGNSGEWYPVVVDWCRDKKLTAFANSDIHQPVDLQYDLSIPYSHRPMTLLFAKDRSEEGVKEALFSRRTLAFTGEQLMGPQELILDLFRASVKVHPPYLSKESRGKKMVYRELENPTDLTFVLEKIVGESPGETVKLNPQSTVIMRYPEGDNRLSYWLTNCWIGSREHPSVTIE